MFLISVHVPFRIVRIVACGDAALSSGGRLPRSLYVGVRFEHHRRRPFPPQAITGLVV